MKKRFKLYKAGKLWLTAAIIVLGMAAAVTAQADDTVDSATSNTTEQVADTTTSKLPATVNGYNRQSNDQYQNGNGQVANNWQTQGNDWYHFNKGQINTGWQAIDNNWYYMNKNNAKMETCLQKIDNNTYYLNDQHDGTYGAMKTGWQYLNNHWYYFQGNGAAQTGWANINNAKYYLDPATAQMATGETAIGGLHYYFDPVSGHQVKGFVLDSHGLLHYYDEQNGVRQNNLGTYSFNPVTGEIITSSLTNGLNYIANKTVYFDTQSGKFVSNDWRKINNKWYHFDVNGIANTGWYRSGAGLWYLFNNDGSSNSGWYKSGAGLWYYFDPTNAWADVGWHKLNNHWYHFDETNAWADTGWYRSGAGLWYYFDPTNADARTGWFQSAAGLWYHFDQTNAWADTGWHYINNHWYYFDPTNAWADTGYHVINGVEYYFDPTNADMYQNRWVNVNGWTYHADNSGHLWFPRWYSQFTPVFWGEGCSVFSLAMLLSPKEYINTNYALQILSYRQSGNLVNGAGFSLIIQPDSLVELAHHFDSSVRNISGSSVQDIINIVNSGHPVQYYGYSSYERSYVHRNHNKVIVGYRNGYFEIFDPCYWSVNDGWYSRGGNSFDYGAKAWVSVAQFSREYAGQAITVD